MGHKYAYQVEIDGNNFGKGKRRSIKRCEQDIGEILAICTRFIEPMIVIVRVTVDDTPHHTNIINFKRERDY